MPSTFLRIGSEALVILYVHVYMQPQITAIGLFLPRIFFSFLSNYNGYFVLNYNQHTVINRYPHI